MTSPISDERLPNPRVYSTRKGMTPEHDMAIQLQGWANRALNSNRRFIKIKPETAFKIASILRQLDVTRRSPMKQPYAGKAP